MREERECLHRMDREGLLRLARDKEALARRMRKLNSRKEQLQDENSDASSSVQGVSDLLRTRNTLLQEFRVRSHVKICIRATGTNTCFNFGPGADGDR